MAERKELYAAVKLIESYCASRLAHNKRGLSYVKCTHCDLHFLCYSGQLKDAACPVNWPDPPEED